MSDNYAVGFPPVSKRDARVLVLGSLPGKRSLSEVQYYAQPRNAFWRIMGDLFDAGPDVEYSVRLERLTEQRIALWDVVHAAVRPGSLDSEIDRSSIVINDFRKFFENHPMLEIICFNGKTAADLFRRRVTPSLPESQARTASSVLPSTSPAYAAMSYADKLISWTAALSSHLDRNQVL